MERTTSNDFRANLKEWMEAARVDPVKITRKSGEAFVLLNADVFEKMQFDLVRMQGLTASLVDLSNGRTSSSTERSTQDVLSSAKARALGLKKSKKAVS